MTSIPKLSSWRSAIDNVLLQTLQRATRHLVDRTVERPPARPLRDIDEWSDQSEIAFYEERHGCRA